MRITLDLIDAAREGPVRGEANRAPEPFGLEQVRVVQGTAVTHLKDRVTRS